MAQPRDADGLICAFAAVKSAEILADDGFAGERHVIGGCDQVEIDAAYDDDRLTHFWRLRVCIARESTSLAASRARQTAAGKKKRGTPFGMTWRTLFREGFSG